MFCLSSLLIIATAQNKTSSIAAARSAGTMIDELSVDDFLTNDQLNLRPLHPRNSELEIQGLRKRRWLVRGGLVGSFDCLVRRKVSPHWQVMRDEHHNVKPSQQPIFAQNGLNRVVYAHCRAAASHGRHDCFWMDSAQATQPALRNPANSAILRCWVV